MSGIASHFAIQKMPTANQIASQKVLIRSGTQIPAGLQLSSFQILDRLLIFIKKSGLLQFWSSALSALTFTCGRDNLKSFPSILSKFVMHVSNDHTVLGQIQ